VTVPGAPAPARPGEFHPLRLGALAVWPPVVLAPMAGVTNAAFRTICRGFGAGLYVSEMITARGLLEGNARTRLLASSSPDEHPRSVQLYGSDPDVVGEAARVLVGEGVDHVDLNFGCPAAKITRQGGGAAIPLRPRLLGRIVGAAVRAAGDVPVTVKMRTGIDDHLLTFHEAGRVAEREGARAVGLHARTAAQLYAGAADWRAIAELKAVCTVPVLGNGDVWECWDALRMLRETGCDGVIVGRGCLRRPWLFGELAAVFDGREPAPQPRLGEIVVLMQRHARLLVDFFGPERGMRQMRKWCAWYTTGFRNSAAVRRTLSTVETYEAMVEVLAGLDPDEPFPLATVRHNRVKDNRTQRVTLPRGYLESRDDDAVPALPHDAAELAAFEHALDGG